MNLPNTLNSSDKRAVYVSVCVIIAMLAPNVINSIIAGVAWGILWSTIIRTKTKLCAKEETENE